MTDTNPSLEPSSNQSTDAQADGGFKELLLKEFRPRTDEAKGQVEKAISSLAELVLKDTKVVSDDVFSTLESIIANIDKKMSEQLNEVIHDPEFQKIEGAWRGLDYLVSNTETDEKLKIRVMNMSRDELQKMFKRYKGAAWDQSPLFKRVYESEYGQLGGEPYGCLVGDFYLDHGPQDVEFLKGMSRIAAASHAPFIASAGPGLLQMDSWQELSNPRDLTKILTTPEYASWKTFRQSEDARYVTLTMPRYLTRLPYGPDTNPVEGFAFEETTSKGDSSQYCWGNAAYLMATNINRSFKEYGWCTRIRGVESGGNVVGLPSHTFPSDDGGVDQKCPTEVAISDRREAELSKNGILSLVHRKNTDTAAFISAQTLQEPAKFEDPDASKNAELAARLPYLFSTSRFAHYLKCIVRDKVGSFKTREEMEKWLKKWIVQYVDGDPQNSSERAKAERPLASAEVVVEEDESNPGYYKANFYLKPHYQLEGLTVSLRLVSKLPSVKSA